MKQENISERTYNQALLPRQGREGVKEDIIYPGSPASFLPPSAVATGVFQTGSPSQATLWRKLRRLRGQGLLVSAASSPTLFSWLCPAQPCGLLMVTVSALSPPAWGSCPCCVCEHSSRPSWQPQLSVCSLPVQCLTLLLGEPKGRLTPCPALLAGQVLLMLVLIWYQWEEGQEAAHSLPSVDKCHKINMQQLMTAIYLP